MVKLKLTIIQRIILVTLFSQTDDLSNGILELAARRSILKKIDPTLEELEAAKVKDNKDGSISYDTDIKHDVEISLLASEVNLFKLKIVELDEKKRVHDCILDIALFFFPEKVEDEYIEPEIETVGKI